MIWRLFSILIHNFNKPLARIGAHTLTYWDVFVRYIFPRIKTGKVEFTTSGSTGEPKVIRHNINEFLQRYAIRRTGYITLITLDVTKLGGFDALLHVFFYNGFAIIPLSNVPFEIMRLINKYHVELLITSPSMLRLMLLCEMEDYTFPTLKIIAYGSEKMPEDVFRILSKVFPCVKLKQTYGLTEVGTLRTHSEGTLIQILDKEWKVLDDILYIKVDDKWICTHDVVEQVGEFIRILGRETNLINVGGNKVQVEEVEEVLDSICEDSVVYGEVNNFIGNIVVADVVSQLPKEQIIEHCKSKLEKYKVPMKLNYVDSIPRTINGKRKRNYENRNW